MFTKYFRLGVQCVVLQRTAVPGVHSPTRGARLSDCSALYTSAEQPEYSPNCSILSLSPDPALSTCPASEVSPNSQHTQTQHTTNTR